MRIEMLDSERSILEAMGGVSQATERLFYAVKRRMLLAGVAYELSKETLAIISTLTAAGGLDAATGRIEPEDVPESIDSEAADFETTPNDDEVLADAEELPQTSSNGRHKDTYTGSRIKWPTIPFHSKPGDPLSKVEKGRPITYISPTDGLRYAGKFVRISPRDKSKVLVMSHEKKKAFAVEGRHVAITDLSPPSPDPLPVQI